MSENTGKTYKGEKSYPSNFNVEATFPLDDRLVVNSIEALTDGSIDWPYKGMVVNIAGTSDLYVFIGGNKSESRDMSNWKKASGGGGVSKYSVPIMTEDMRLAAIADSDVDFDASDDYIGVEMDYESIDGATTTNTVTTQNGTYIDILFSAIRSLQAEVNRLKNTFKYGINSYTDTDTALSAISGGDMGDDDSDEPIWAIDPDDVSELTEITRINEDGLKRFSKSVSGNNVYWTEQNSQDKITITDFGSTFSLNESEVKAIKAVADTKLLLYFQIACNKSGDTYALPEIDINLNALENLSSTNDDNNIHFKPFDILGANVEGGLRPEYNVMVIISRKQENKDETDVNKKYTGKNYIYCSISDKRTDEVIKRGYWNTDGNVYNKISLSDIEERYYWDKIGFKDLTITECRFCSKYQDFSNEVVPANPDNKNDFKYEAAHITIRSVSTKDVAKNIKDQLQENELIWVKSENIMLIKSDGLLRVVTSGNNNFTEDSDNEEIENMTTQELLEKLMSMGIIVNTKADGSDEGSDPDFDFLEFNDVASITFINQDTDKRYKFTVDPYGQLKSTEVLDNDLQKLIDDYNEDKTEANKFKPDTECNNYRGFIANLRRGSNAINAEADFGDNSDRLRISGFFVPLKSATKCGCSHSFIELENSSTKDIPLKGMILHHKYFNGSNWVLRHLPLEGICKKGSTYLIRGAQHADLNSPSTFIKVTEFDQEWWEEVNGKKQLVSFELDNTLTVENKEELGKNIHSFYITYGEIKNLSAETIFVTYDKSNTKFPYTIKNTSYVEGCIYLPSKFTKDNGMSDTVFPSTKVDNYEYPIPLTENSMFRLMFKLDPAKQAFNGFNITKDSSRERYKNNTDAFVVNLDRPTITFKTSPYEYPIERYTPHASSYGATVMTDKTRLDFDKPNMVNVAFGIDVYKTRCFSWVSVGAFDEYVWVKKSSESTWTRFESYKSGDSSVTTNGITKKTFNNVLKKAAYDRINANFPGDNTPFTAHKCILEFANVSEQPTTYDYRVGRGCGFGNNTLDEDHCSETRHFTLYPTTWEGRVYQVTDQQGFHWVEYQAWAGAAKALRAKIDADNLTSTNEFPIIINTGDMTQSGARINEWLDYHMAGDILFKDFEQMNVVGNNDLNDINPEILGTGNDSGKSVSRFFHYFYCHEVPNDESLVMGPDLKYIPSTYYFKTLNMMYLCFNSEMTTTTSNKWLKLNYVANATIDPYTGIVALTSTDTAKLQNAIVDDETATSLHFTPLYKTIYNWLMLNRLDKEPKAVVFACHEIPFTVITVDSLQTLSELGYTKDTRNYPSGSSLLGSHANQMDKKETSGIFWLSRMFEHFGVRLAIGGHKHTYAISWPLQEFYKYTKPENTYYMSYDNSSGKFVTIPSESVNAKGVVQYLERIVDVTLNEKDFTTNTIKYNGDDTGNLTSTLLSTTDNAFGVDCGGELGKSLTYLKNNFGSCDGFKYIRLTKYNSGGTCTSKPSTASKNDNSVANMGQMLMTWNQMENEATATLVPGDTTTNFTAGTPVIKIDWTMTINGSGDNGKSEYGDLYCLNGENSGSSFVLNTTKTPLMDNTSGRFGDSGFVKGLYRCVTPISTQLNNPVVYFMLQATGYKVTSNKELPSQYQYFSNILPKTTNVVTISTVNGKTTSTVTSTANINQGYPMFAVIKVTKDKNGVVGADLYMARIKGIYLTAEKAKVTFTQGTEPDQTKPSYEWLTQNDTNCYGNWSTNADISYDNGITTDSKMTDVTYHKFTTISTS